MIINPDHKTIIFNLYKKHTIGAKHTHPEKVLRGTRNGKKALKELIKSGYIISHPTSYGEQISLNHKMIAEIENILGIK